MKIVNAHWEYRNLGVNCTELNLDPNDSMVAFKEALETLDSGYQVIRIPSGRTDLLLAAQNMHFQVIEMSIQIAKVVDEYSLPKIFKRFESHIIVSEATQEDIDRVLNLMRNGDLFTTDRISLDPYFTSEQSGERFYNWTKDSLDNGAHIFIAKYKGESAGFGVNYTTDGKRYVALFGGVFPEFAGKGLGFTALHTNMVSIINQGGTSIVTAVSSNNQPILRLHESFGYQVQELHYVLIKHHRELEESNVIKK